MNKNYPPRKRRANGTCKKSSQKGKRKTPLKENNILFSVPAVHFFIGVVSWMSFIVAKTDLLSHLLPEISFG